MDAFGVKRASGSNTCHRSVSYHIFGAPPQGEPRFSFISSCLNQPPFNQHLSTTIKAVKINEKIMSQTFSNNPNSFNAFNSYFYDEKPEILSWLSPLRPPEQHRCICNQRIDNIGAWLLETREFRAWHDGNGENKTDCASLFCDGSPGVGKSHIM